MSDTVVITQPLEQFVIAGAGQGPQGPRGNTGSAGGESVTRTAGEGLGGHRVVALTSANEVVYASSADVSATKVFGFTSGAVSVGEDADIKTQGVLDWPAADLTPDSPVYLTTDGQVSHTPPSSGYIRQVGIALAANKLQVAIGPVYQG